MVFESMQKNKTNGVYAFSQSFQVLLQMFFNMFGGLDATKLIYSWMGGESIAILLPLVPPSLALRG
jgi:hypothetical protein